MKLRCRTCKRHAAQWKVRGVFYCNTCVQDVRCKGSELEELPPKVYFDKTRGIYRAKVLIGDKAITCGAAKTRTEAEQFRYPLEVLSMIGES